MAGAPITSTHIVLTTTTNASARADLAHNECMIKLQKEVGLLNTICSRSSQVFNDMLCQLKSLYTQISDHAHNRDLKMAAKRGFDYDDLESDFDPSEKGKRSTWQDDPLGQHREVHLPHSSAVPSKLVASEERDKEEWRARRFHLLSMDAYSRHKALVNQYLLATGRGIEQFTRPMDRDRNDYDVLREEHQFLWEGEVDSWEKKLAKTYYDKLFKEYTICDLSRYKENQVALRWRVESEVISGKGQFICGSKKCSEKDELESWEVNFAYVEHGERKNALVKLRLCPACSRKLNYHHKKTPWRSRKSKGDKRKDRKRRSGRDEEEEGRSKSNKKHKKKRKHRSNEDDHSSSSSEEG